MRAMKKAALIIIVLSLFAGAGAQAQAKTAGMRFGMLFSVTGITLEDLQGGFGASLTMDAMRFRAAADARFKDSNINPDELDLGLTGVFEYHLLKGQVSPYVGGFLGYRFEMDRNTVDAANWTANIDHIIGGGPLAGVEFFILDNLSFFAEYELAFNVTFPIATVCTDGAVTDTPQEMEFLMDARLGNGAMLGITVYF